MLDDSTATAEHRPAILIVDDQPTIRTVLARLLTGHGGFAVSEADNGFAALEHLSKRRPGHKHGGAMPSVDLVVLDIMMPILNGLEVLEALRWMSPVLPKTMVVSALDDEANIIRALQLGAVDYFPKPIDPGMFLHRVETLCSTRVPGGFHWAPLPRAPAIRLGGHAAEVKAISESGIIVQAGPEERPAIGDIVELASPVFTDCDIRRCVRGRVVRSTCLRGRRTIELSFVGLHERDVSAIRRFSVRR